MNITNDINKSVSNRTNLSFTAHVEKKFIDGAIKFCDRNNEYILSKRMLDFLDKVETYGSSDSEILYLAKRQKKGFMHHLCLKNLELDNKQALVLYASEKFTDIIKFLINLTDAKLLSYEEILGRKG